MPTMWLCSQKSFIGNPNRAHGNIGFVQGIHQNVRRVPHKIPWRHFSHEAYWAKKQCLARYNLGHADPSVVAGIPSGQNESAGEGSITTLSFQGRKDVSLPPGVRDNSGYINSFNTYAFPHRNNSNSSSYVYSSHKASGGHQ
jgi:hypothetical protein